MPRERLPIGGIGAVRTVQTGPKRWQASARIRDTDGVVRQIKASAPTKGKAENALKANAIQRVPPTAGSITANSRFGVVAKMWIKELERSDAKTGTIRAYKRTVENHVIPKIGALTVREVTASRVQSLVDALTVSSGPTTAKQARGRISQILDMCVRDDAITHNPVRSIKLARTHRVSVTALTAVDVQAIREHVTRWGSQITYGPPRNAMLILDFLDMLAATGCRPGELLALRWEDVDLTAGTVKISGTVVRTAEGLVRQDSPKSESSNRVIQLPRFGVLVLKKRYMRAVDKAAPVFASRAGGWIEASNLQRLWNQARGNKFRHVTFRDYRKAVATVIRKAEGMDAAASQLGHSSPEITRRHYVERDGRVDFSVAVETLGVSS